jgi:hypothetical protein
VSTRQDDSEAARTDRALRLAEMLIEKEKEKEKKQGGKCFIATATYGTEGHRDVRTLRHFRDSVLCRCKAGRWLCEVYHRVSPSAARWVSGSARRRRIVRLLLVQPVVWVACCAVWSLGIRKE